jgi:hypothetical protein
MFLGPDCLVGRVESFLDKGHPWMILKTLKIEPSLMTCYNIMSLTMLLYSHPNQHNGIGIDESMGKVVCEGEGSLMSGLQNRAHS